MADMTDFNDVQAAIENAKELPGGKGVNGAAGSNGAGSAPERLAKLSPMDYDRVRQAEAEALGVRVTTLDAEVSKMRPAGDNDIQGKDVVFPEIDPWPEPVDGAQLVADLESIYRRYAVVPPHTPTALALWALFTHAIHVVNIAPILVLTSPEHRCGKSTVLALLSRLTHRPLSSANITAAALFRSIEAWSPTLLIDEADSFLKVNEEMRGVLNSGHTRESAFVIRTAGEDHEPRKFSTWGAKAIALIGKLPITLADRSIEVALKRKLSGEQVEKLRHAEPALILDLKRRCSRWVADHLNEIRAARPSMPEGLHDRAEDNWEPLLAIADLAGGDWPNLARMAAVALSGGDDTDGGSLRTQLLADIRGVVMRRSADRISSEDLSAALVALEERPWSEYSRGKPLTKNRLSSLLKPFGVVSKTVDFPDGRSLKGYFLAQFADPFARYLPANSSERREVDVARVPGAFEIVGERPIRRFENALKPSCGAGSDVPTFSEGGSEGDGGVDALPEAEPGWKALI